MSDVRVLTIQGREPAILCVPHGADKENLTVIAEMCARTLHCGAVINFGFHQYGQADANKDLADCHKIDHVISPVVQDEYLDPLVNMANRFSQKIRKSLWFNLTDTCAADLPKVLVLHICGTGNEPDREAGEKVSMIVGFGAGASHDSITCTNWKKNCFIASASHYFDYAICEGKGAGRYAGRPSDCMNQYFVRKQPNRMIDSLQITVPWHHWETNALAEEYGLKLALTINRVWKFKNSKEFSETIRARAI